MKSIIVSAFFGTALLAIQGVSGAAVPIDVVERDEPFQLPSENTNFQAAKRAALPEASSTNICIHNTEGSVECSDVTIKRENVPDEDTLEKRKLKFRDNYEDKADEYMSHVLAPRDVAYGDRPAEVPGVLAPYPKDKRTQPLRPATKWIAAVQQPAELVVARPLEIPTTFRVKPT
ncbi:MAG: hypothetical protein Q9180_006617 [Flavoplaca navasiana]